jgi:hypothetical protein
MNITMNPIRKEQSSYIKPMACNLPLPYGFGQFEDEGDNEIISRAIMLRTKGYSYRRIADITGMTTCQVWHFTKDVKRI